MQPALNLPSYPFRLKKNQEQWMIFDEVRRKWLVNTPEEWVRQHLIMFLHHHHGYPLGRIQIEGGFKQAATVRRSDILVHDAAGNPWLLVECKRPQIPIDQKVFDQAFQYNRKLGAPYIVITNGMQHHVAECTQEEARFMDELPRYPG